MNPRTTARLALTCLDFTSLNAADSVESIRAFAGRAATPHGAPAALCVYPRFVSTARQVLAEPDLAQVKLATVVNFPQGTGSAAEVVAEVEAALAAGADEIDAVFPWRALRAGDAEAGAAMVRACRSACGDALLKVILETGELQTPALITEAATIAAAEGADFLKTSTGKATVHATPDTVRTLLAVIVRGGGHVGLKVSGGVASLADVQTYVDLVAAACGEGWMTPARLRFGASGLLPVLLAALDVEGAPRRVPRGSPRQ